MEDSPRFFFVGFVLAGPVCKEINLSTLHVQNKQPPMFVLVAQVRTSIRCTILNWITEMRWWYNGGLDLAVTSYITISRTLYCAPQCLKSTVAHVNCGCNLVDVRI